MIGKSQFVQGGQHRKALSDENVRQPAATEAQAPTSSPVTHRAPEAIPQCEDIFSTLRREMPQIVFDEPPLSGAIETARDPLVNVHDPLLAGSDSVPPRSGRHAATSNAPDPLFAATSSDSVPPRLGRHAATSSASDPLFAATSSDSVPPRLGRHAATPSASDPLFATTSSDSVPLRQGRHAAAPGRSAPQFEGTSTPKAPRTEAVGAATATASSVAPVIEETSESAVRDAVALALQQNEGRPFTQRTLSSLFNHPAFGDLPPKSRLNLIAYVNTANDPTAALPFATLMTLVSDPAFVQAPREQQSARLLAFVEGQQGAPSQVALQGWKARPRADYTVSLPEPVASHPFHSGDAPAVRRIVTVGGRDIPVFMPATASDLPLPSIDLVARALGKLPAACLAAIRGVDCNPRANPDDVLWAERYHSEHFQSAMTAGATGVIDIYPSQSCVDWDFLERNLIHETGHVLSKSTFSAEQWAEYEAAIARDGMAPSRYAQNSRDEDFAETLELYMLSVGTPSEARQRTLMPHRFALLDRLLDET